MTAQMAPLMEVTATYLASTDSRDKLIKGAGCFFKLLGSINGNPNNIKVGAAMSDCRSLMRLLSWLSNVQKLEEALQKRVVHPRDVMYVLRVAFDGVFSFLDNIVYMGRFFKCTGVPLGKLSYISRASLFYGYVAAVLLDIYDLMRNVDASSRAQRCLVLVRNVCDMVSSVGNVCRISIGDANVALLGLISAVIASRELFLSARSKSQGRRLK